MTVESATVRLDRGDELHAMLESAPGDALRLVLSTPPARALHGERATVEWTTRRGVHRIAGRLHAERDAPEILVLERDGTPEIIQRRQYVRVDAVVEVDVTITDPQSHKVHTNTLDVSGGGMLLVDQVGLELEQELDLEMDVGDGRAPVRAHVRVVRATLGGEKGVEILAIAEPDRDRLIRFVTERERQALRMVRRP